MATDEEILALAERHHPLLMGIDAPLSLPRGLCCLEESCPCQPLSPKKGRECERALARLGISCYFTTKRSIIEKMVRRALALKKELARRGHQVIEVYPYASKVRLFGRLPRKTSGEGRVAVEQRLWQLVPGLKPQRLNHDLADAILAAYTAYLHRAGETEEVGESEEGMIVIPRGHLLLHKFS